MAQIQTDGVKKAQEGFLVCYLFRELVLYKRPDEKFRQELDTTSRQLLVTVWPLKAKARDMHLMVISAKFLFK